MYRRAFTFLAGMTLGLSAGHAQDAASAPGEPVWSAQKAGGLAWAQTVVTADFSRCGGAAVLAAQERDPQLEAQMQTDASGYSCYLLGVRNDTARRIQCQVRMEQPYGAKKPAVVEGALVLDPDTQGVAVESFALTTTAPRAVSTKCFEIPESPSPYKDRADCRGTFDAPSPQRFYPADSRDRLEEGGVVIEYGVIKGSRQPQDIRVVTSSGFAALDTAALRMAYESQASHRCTNIRYRARIVFRLADSPLNELTGGS